MKKKSFFYRFHTIILSIFDEDILNIRNLHNLFCNFIGQILYQLSIHLVCLTLRLQNTVAFCLCGFLIKQKVCWLRFFLFVLPNHGKVSDNCYYWKSHVGFLRFGKWNQTVNINVDNSFTRKVFILLMDICMKTKKKLYINTILHYFVFFYHFTSIFKIFLCNIFLFLNTHSINWMIVLIQNELGKKQRRPTLYIYVNVYMTS